MAKKIIVTDIDWDTDGEKVNLPDTVIIDDPTEEMIEDVEADDYADSVGDALSDTYGWCVFGFKAAVA